MTIVLEISSDLKHILIEISEQQQKLVIFRPVLLIFFILGLRTKSLFYAPRFKQLSLPPDRGVPSVHFEYAGCFGPPSQNQFTSYRFSPQLHIKRLDSEILSRKPSYMSTQNELQHLLAG